MIIGDCREAVIANIATAASQEEFHRKVEVNDPELTAEQSRQIVDQWMKRRKSTGYRTKAWAARHLANVGTRIINRDTELVGLEKLHTVTGGAILTCNHFSPLDNTVVRHLTRKMGKKRINIISQITNFAMPGVIGFLMNYADTIPLGEEPQFLLRTLPEILQELVSKDEWVLIYPEKEMWFNYRKPRPMLRGAYHFAAKLGKPIVSCFIEMRDEADMDTEQFHKVRYILHILDVLTPDPAKSVRENSIELCARDTQLKTEAYERIYGRKLSYDFAPEDIAGWVG